MAESCNEQTAEQRYEQKQKKRKKEQKIHQKILLCGFPLFFSFSVTPGCLLIYWCHA